MTPEEIANAQLVTELRDADLMNVTSAQELTDKIFRAVWASIRAAIAAERDDILDMASQFPCVPSRLLDAIRARKEIL